MNCQECGMRPATLHFTKIINGQKTESHLCEKCAQDKGEMLPGNVGGFSLQNLLSGLIHFDTKQSAQISPSAGERCGNCGLTFNQFSKMGRFGCSECYGAFEHRLEPLFRRIHGNTKHSGKVPKRIGGTMNIKKQIQQLKHEMQKHIADEEFEKAAATRDRIRAMENSISNDL